MPYRLKPSKESLKYIYKYFFQVIPTQLRGQGIAIVSVMSMVSQMASPLIVYSVRLYLFCQKSILYIFF